MSRLLPALLVAGLLMLQAAPVAAQCDLTMTPEGCLAAVEDALRADGVAIIEDDPATAIEETKEVVLSESEDILRLFNTGITSALNDGGVTTMVDFLPKFKVFAAGGGSGEDAGRIVLELNDFLGLPTDHGYKFSTILAKPAVFDPLLQTIAEDMRANEKDTLENQLDDFDNVTFALTYSPMTQRWGRSDHQLHQDIFSDLFESAEAQQEAFREETRVRRENAETAVNEAMGAALDALHNNPDPTGVRSTILLEDWSTSGTGFCAGELAKDEILDLVLSVDLQFLTGDQLLCGMLSADPSNSAQVNAAQTAEDTRAIDEDLTAIVEEYIASVGESQQEEYASLAALQETLTTNGFFSFADLVNNQPQLNFSASYSSLDEFVGQDQFSVKVSYEMGFVNANNFRKFVSGGCAADYTYECLGEYLTDARRQQLKRGDRVSFDLEYIRKQSYDAVLASGAGMLSLPSSKSLKASVAYGRYMTFLANGAGNSRVDVSASYEDVDGDSERNNRLFGTVTYSQRMSDAAVVSFSLVYANKPEYRGEVGNEISAQLGLNYRMFSPKEF